jgi:hypothetical protein
LAEYALVTAGNLEFRPESRCRRRQLVSSRRVFAIRPRQIANSKWESTIAGGTTAVMGEEEVVPEARPLVRINNVLREWQHQVVARSRGGATGAIDDFRKAALSLMALWTLKPDRPAWRRRMRHSARKSSWPAGGPGLQDEMPGVAASMGSLFHRIRVVRVAGPARGAIMRLGRRRRLNFSVQAGAAVATSFSSSNI